MDAYDQINKELEKQEDELEKLLAEGQITQAQYNKRMKQLQREAREELRYTPANLGFLR